MSDNIFEKLTPEEQGQLWMYMMFNREKIIEKTEEWTKEAEKRGMTLIEYLESINPLRGTKCFLNAECKEPTTSDIELVIKIPEEVRLALINNIQLSPDQQSIRDSYINHAIINGTPLPKGHGKIVDIGKIDEDRVDDDNPVIYLTVNGEYIEAVSLDYLNGLPAIVEAEKRRQ